MPKIEFCSLPFDLMPQALQARAIDGFVAPSPWGLFADEAALDLNDDAMEPKGARQIMAVVQRGDDGFLRSPLEVLLQSAPGLFATVPTRAEILAACHRMSNCGPPVLPASAIIEALHKYAFPQFYEFPVDTPSVEAELRRLDSMALLPTHLNPISELARLLLIHE